MSTVPDRGRTGASAAVALLLFGALAASAFAAADAPSPILPARLSWVRPPALTGVEVAWVLGTERAPGPYLLRVKLAAQAKIPPHTHPDTRNSTVLSGTIYVGFGDSFDESKLVAVPAGAVYVAPANVPHYLWAKDGDAMYQESGFGPSATDLVGR